MEGMSLPNFIKFEINLVAVNSVKNFYGVAKCDIATIGLLTTYVKKNKAIPETDLGDRVLRC
jgi:hypothetical protein